MFMSTLKFLMKEQIVSLSQLQKNPGKYLQSGVVRIVKNGREVGVFIAKDDFEDFVEETLSVNTNFKPRLEKSFKKSVKKGRSISDLI